MKKFKCFCVQIIFHFEKEVNINVYIIEKTLKLNFFFHLNNIKVGTSATFPMKNGLNKMQPIMFSQQVGWFVGKGIDLCACGPRMKPHN